MSGIAEYWKDVGPVLKQERKRDGENNRKQASYDFAAAVEIANKHGMALVRRTDFHYQLRHTDGWLLNIYPGNQRLYADRNRKVRAPRVDLHIAAEERRCWTLLDVVLALVRDGHGRVSA